MSDWEEYKREVMYRLDTLTKQIESIDTKVSSIKIDLTVMKVKVGIYGAIGGFIVVVIAQIITLLIK
jgi:tetrahydromethanopterin S-methyltransferase subunit G